METTKKKRTREEVRAAFREYLKDKKQRMEEKQRELEEIHQMRMVILLKSFCYEHAQIKHY